MRGVRCSPISFAPRCLTLQLLNWHTCTRLIPGRVSPAWSAAADSLVCKGGGGI